MARSPQVISPLGLFPGPNAQVTYDAKRSDGTSGSRSECDLAVDPANSDAMIAVSKRFIDNQQYKFTTASSYSADGGYSWTDSRDLWLDASQGWVGYTDPAIAFDDKSTAYLVSEPIIFVGAPDEVKGRGMYCFRSGDNGATWQAPPTRWDNDPNSDKQWIASDVWESSLHKGSVYACWGAITPLRFSRSSDGGNTWRGAGSQTAGAPITTQQVYAPAICVSGDGTIHVAWHNPGSSTILYLESNDGGDNFSTPKTVVQGIGDISNKFPPPPHGDFPVFPGGSFRVITLVSIAPIGARGCVIAWADARGPFTRIYYRVRDEDGNWSGDIGGRPVLANIGVPDSLPVQHFHPQLAVNRSGVVACAFYEFGQKHPDNAYRIDVRIASSSLLVTSPFPVDFFYLATVTEQAWDPKIDAPLSHGNAAITFIGEYFGLDSAGDDFCVLWTDTRTGKQELWFSRVATFRRSRGHPGPIPPEIVGIISPGVAAGASGWIWIKGVRYPVPPRGPANEILELLAAYGIVVESKSRNRVTLANQIMKAISNIASGKGGTPRRGGR
jgi:hypothetical protein